MIPAQYKILGVIALMALSAWGGREWRDRSCDLEATQKENTQLSDTLTAERQARAKSAFIAGEIVAELEAKEPEVRTIVKEVVRYETDPDVQHCSLDREWVRLHDRAAGLSDPGTAPGDHGGAEAAEDARALEVVTDNYAACSDYITRLRGCQRWIRGVRQ